MPPHRDVAAFEDRAAGYQEGWRGRLHHDIIGRTAVLALSASTAPRRVVDIGCGTGYLLRLLARQWPQATELAGIDPAPSMIEAAAGPGRDERLRFSSGAAERLPCPGSSFDLVVSTTSFDHLSDQQAGLRECARVLMPGGHLMLVDLFTLWLIPTLVGGRRERREPRDKPTSCSAPQASSRSPGTTSTPSSSRP
ncbi:MAG TPA: class I SAM-dependent methyltransferase [Streptosporangiaceae bacterium]|nr:class I SAM-dependent methyltransferase [Streptosporangiaceae bacterium]